MHRPVLVTAPSEMPVSRTEAKRHLRVDASDDDELIDGLIAAAVSYLDGYSGVLGRCLVTQTWRQDFDRFAQCMRLPLPAATISSIKVRSSAGTLSTISASDYSPKADEIGSYVRFSDAYSFPNDLAQSQAVLVEFTSGYGDAAAVPPAIRTAIVMLVAHWYANREAVSAGSSAALPFGVDALLAPYRRVGL